MPATDLVKRLRQAGPAAGLAIALAAHVGLCLLPAREILSTGVDVPRFGSSDGFYHAHRIRMLFEAFPDAVFMDRSMAFPHGAIVEWPLGFDWSLAAALRALGTLSASSWDELVWYLPFVPLLLSLAAVLVFRWIAGRLLGPPAAALATIALGASLALVGQSLLGQLDHHVAEALGVVLLLCAPEVVSARGSRNAAIALGVLLAWLVWCSTLFAWLLALVAFSWLVARVLVRERQDLPHLVWLVAPLLALSLPAVALESQARAAWLSAGTLSMLQWFAMAAILGGLLVSRWLRPVTLAVAVLIAFICAWAVSPGSLRWVLGLVTATDSFLTNVTEAKPLFVVRDGLSIRPALVAFGPLYFAVPFLLLAAWRRRALDRGCWTWTVVLFLLSLSQKRFGHLFAPAYVLLVFAVVATLPSRWRRGASVLAVLLLVVPAATYRTDLAHYTSDSTRVAWQIGDVLEERARPGDAIAVPPNYGNALLYRTRLAIVTNTFFHARYLKRDLLLRSFEDDQALRSHLLENRIRWLVAADDIRYRHMLLEMFHRDREAKRLEPLRYKPCDRALLRWALDRLACLDQPFEGFERVQTFTAGSGPRAMVRRLVLYRIEGTRKYQFASGAQSMVRITGNTLMDELVDRAGVNRESPGCLVDGGRFRSRR